MVRTRRFTAGTRVQSLVGELRSWKPHGATKKKNKKKNQKKNPKFIPSQFWRLESKIRVSVGPSSSKMLGRILPGPFVPSVVAVDLGLQLNLCLLVMWQSLCVSFSFFFKKIFTYSFIHSFIYLWLHWVFIAVRGLSLVAAIGGDSSLRCACFSLRWLLLLWSMALGPWASVVLACGLSSCGSWVLERRLSSCGARA